MSWASAVSSLPSFLAPRVGVLVPSSEAHPLDVQEGGLSFAGQLDELGISLY